MITNIRHVLLFSMILSLTQTSCSKIEPPTHSNTNSQKDENYATTDTDRLESKPHDHGSKSKHEPSHHEEGHKTMASSEVNKSRSHSDQPGSHEVSHHATTDSGVEASTAFRWLKNGNVRFMRGTLRNDGQSKQDRQRLVAGQKPHTIVLSCSDSRVPPEVLFDQKLGEIFVVRTAGEALDNTAIASIEYAIEHLGAHLLVVMGHESCGAVKAAFSTLSGGDAGSPSLNALVKDIHPRIRKYLGREPSDKLLTESKANAVGVARDLAARSKIVSEKIESNHLQMETAIYHLASGWVEFYSAAPSRGLASEKSH